MSEKASRQQSRRQAREDAAHTIHRLQLDVMDLKGRLQTEQALRVAAQDGLVPYVRFTEALNVWLLDQPEDRRALAALLRKFGMQGVRIGYDPRRDPAIKAAVKAGKISPNRAMA